MGLGVTLTWTEHTALLGPTPIICRQDGVHGSTQGLWAYVKKISPKGNLKQSELNEKIIQKNSWNVMETVLMHLQHQINTVEEKKPELVIWTPTFKNYRKVKM